MLKIPVAKEGYPFILVALILSLLFGLIGLYSLTTLSSLLTFFTISFFRDPERRIPADEGAIVSPADGKVIFIDRQFEKRYFNKEVLKVSIFMSIFNCHINRSPLEGDVVKRVYNSGRFLSANKDKASLDNEQCFYHIKGREGELGVVQIAGLIARRIVSWKREGEWIKRGERIGLIRFGSRVDLFLPLNARLVVTKGSRVYGGSSVIGFFNHREHRG